jgi:hypothetical protein
MGPRVGEDQVTPHTRPPADDDADHLLVRTARCLEGEVEVELVCEPIFDYGRTFQLVRGAGPAGRTLGFVLVALALSCLVVLPSHLAELFPTPVRSTALAITYGRGSALFGGTAPFLATWLVRRTGAPVAPAVYATLLASAAVVAAVASRETAFQPLSAIDEPRAELARRGP